ncbi:M23 family peptidase [Sphaerisporangium album]|uniref:M23 family peptidase n=1 Tax=Sphaerisporangium album TaxID=509200 RepID=A0A367FR67_9ACTN|nr:peptidoglycan DD-metalloendopeptidase family protein [Sphaerisporangium album]RCG32883.1 M23 family peptidase [Sphaerisporangium album]
MRPGRLAAIAATVLVTAACAAPSGVAGISTLPTTSPRALPSDTGEPSPSPSADRGEIDAATLKPSGEPSGAASPRPKVTPPEGDEPVRVPPPKVSRFTYAFPVKGCRVSYARQQLVLPKSTIWAGKGCAFVAPVGGVVHEVNASNRWTASTDHGADREGRFVSIIGDDGVRYLGGHLDAVAQGIRPGVRVSAGQVLGQVGDSGNAKGQGTNLYFALSWSTSSKYWWVRRGMVDPWTYLDAWLSGNPTLSPAARVSAVRAAVGATPPCRTLCASKPQKKPTRRPVPTQTGDPSDVRRG